ncbi:MAG: TatD family deoxyribonuclease [Ruminococcaceae bacterium]|nr:TatD family deoxyribonuclease [Oscillospiraceae bacterium]
MDASLGFFDSHAHYYDERFYSEENEQGAEALLQVLFSEGLLGVINVGTNEKTNRIAIEQAKHFQKMYVAVGIHPEDMAHSELTLDEQMEDLRGLVCDAIARKENKIVAIGEIGLDYYWEPYDKEKQKTCFERQMELAQELDIPVIIHDREAHGDCFETVLKYPNVKGVFHSYSGSAEMARELVKRGWYISFSGVVSFKNASKIKDVAKIVPDDKILIETDAPYLAPHPFRGKINHSGRLLYTAQALADARGCTIQSVAELTKENAYRLFKIF